MLTSLQAGRAIAAIAVAIFHANSYFIPERFHPGIVVAPVLNAGFAGVEYFFVLSGFIMMFVHQRDMGIPNRAPGFLLKRVLRIYPFYWAILFALVAAYALVPGAGDDANLSPGAVLASALLVPTSNPMIIAAAWTLSHEMLFYLLFTTAFFSMRLALALFGLWIAAILASSILIEPTFPLSFLLSPYNLLFAGGVAAAAGYRNLPPVWRWPAATAGLAVVVAIAAGDATGPIDLPEWLRTLALGLSGALAVAGFAALESSGSVRAPRWLVFLGDASYSIYLIHGIVMAIGGLVFRRLGLASIVPAPLTLVAIVAAAVAAGVIAHLVVERPLLAGARHLVFGRRPAKAVA